MYFSDIISMAWQNLSNNKLRTGITVAIISFGLMALIGILTSIDAMKLKLKESFSFMGANAFTIQPKERKISLGGTKTTLEKKETVQKNSGIIPPITFEEAKLFQENFQFPAEVSVMANGNKAVTIRQGTQSTNPNVSLLSGDEHYVSVNGFALAHGRNMLQQEVNAGHNVCLIGQDVANKFYKGNKEKAVGDMVQIQGIPFTIIGVLKNKGSGAFLSFDNTVITNNKASLQLGAVYGYTIAVKVNEVHQMEAAITESKGLFKSIRNIKLEDEPNFAVVKSDRLATLFLNASSTITFAAMAIGFITLLGAAIGLMNIMLVAVNERTKEIGLSKAVGSTSAFIKNQFLMESVFISLLGALGGIVIGLLIGNLVGYFLEVPFFVPWNWVIGGIILCTISGILAGLLPAIKASKLNPIEALRYE